LTKVEGPIATVVGLGKFGWFDIVFTGKMTVCITDYQLAGLKLFLMCLGLCKIVEGGDDLLHTHHAEKSYSHLETQHLHFMLRSH